MINETNEFVKKNETTVSNPSTGLDRLVVLKSRDIRLAKLWTTGNTVKSYDDAKLFTPTVVEVRNLSELSAELTRWAATPYAAVIRGKQRNDGDLVATDAGLNPQELAVALRRGYVRKANHYFEDQPLHSVCIDVDNFAPMLCDPIEDPVEAILEFIYTQLPRAFHGAGYHWQLSGSAGHTSKAGLNVHLWFWLAEPLTSAQLKAWANATGANVDKALFSPTQWHYTAAPLFEDGVADPISVRSGLVDGPAVHLAIDETVQAAKGADFEPLMKPRRMVDSIDPNVLKLFDKGLVVEEFDHGLGVRCINFPHRSGESGNDQSMYFPVGVGGRKEPGYKCMHEQCRDTVTATIFLRETGIDVPADDFEAGPDQIIERPDGTIADVQPLPAMTRLKNGKVEATRNNLTAVLARPDLCGIHLRYDTFAACVMFAPVDRPNEWRPFTESSRTDVCRHLESNSLAFTFVHIPTALASEIVDNFAEHNKFDSAQTWLESLTWDGVPRVDSFIVRHLRSPDNAYSRAVSRYTLTAMAARVLVHGCKADMVPVFIGRQGAGKSSVVAALAPSPDHFLELDLNKAENDRLREMAGRLIVELGELRGLRAREHEELKQFISRRVDSWIPKYKESARNYPRRSIFIGTSNTPEFLSDETGNRRWLPVEVEGHHTPQGVAQAVAAVIAERDMLWAEAAVIFRKDGVAWLEAEALAKPEHARFEIVEPWATAIGQWLDADQMDGQDGPKRGDEAFSTEQVLTHAVGVELRAINDVQRKRVAAVLRKLGFVDRRSTVAGVRATHWHRKE